MKRQFPRFKRPVLAALLTFGAACTPNNNVAPGAPVLTEVKIVEGGGATVTTITPDTPACPATATDGGPCASSVPLCQFTTGKNWCRCAMASPPPPTDAAVTDAGPVDASMSVDSGSAADASTDGASTPADAATVTLDGIYNCGPFDAGAMVLFVFDRLIDTAPFESGDAVAASTSAVGVSIVPIPTPTVSASADYSSNGSPNEVIFPLLGDFFSDGPSLFVGGVPEFPAGSTVTLTLSKSTVLAKDGKTPFSASGALADGIVSFTTGPFTATVAAPMPPDGNGPEPDMTPAIVTFNIPPDPTGLSGHITATAAPATPIDVTVDSSDGVNFNVTPTATWPASATITVTVDATTPDLEGNTLGTTAQAIFMTSAM